ncbi:uncharacterized protein F5891DRAFT_1278155 [Suillus fuscotomentosus]|uniref:Uncharacterized protein n=1 Tax=Suillus fuscotomentosus TaxID=1912939 RepID=A0AAD4E8X6_9AGAM|nr:uncharacterized protein F5891DRAFT_1278155 [Suillus fuscotomentosus]KAG1900589.1 hypothetical protein F5891DRAFT_1278155 [Suillus fuscotomentosus]
MLTPACQAAKTLPQDTDSSESLPVPNGWIVPQRTRNVEQMLKEYTGLKGTLVLSEESGTSKVHFFVGQGLLRLELFVRGWMAPSRYQ